MDLRDLIKEATNIGKGAFVARLVALVILYQLATVIYNLYFHPLRNFPGPFLCRASSLPWALLYCKGIIPFKVHEWHNQYGHAVRVAPNHLSCTDPRAWKDVYGARVVAASDEFVKLDSVTASVPGLPKNIINSGWDEHGRLRKALSPGFSDAALRSQEPIIAKHVNLMLDGLRRHLASQDGSREQHPLNMEGWMNWTTFDLVGELVFGMSFDSLKAQNYHPWVIFMLQSLRDGAPMAAFHYLGLGWVNALLYKTVGATQLKKVEAYTDIMLKHRLDTGSTCQDLFEGFIKRQNEWGMDFATLSNNAMVLILAGSETTATLLSGSIYLLLMHPEQMERLQREVRSAFESDDEINITNVNNLPYLLAVLSESLRLYPPVTSNLIRTVPPGGRKVAEDFVPGGTFIECQPWAMNHSKQNWKNPWMFCPERFLAKDVEDAAEALQPFSLGPRGCVGRNLAYVEMRFILARLIFNFDMRLDDSSTQWIERQKAYPLWDRIPLNVHLVPRK